MALKIHKRPPQTVVRVEIIKRGSECKTITIEADDSIMVSEELKKMLNKQVSVKINPLKKSEKLTVQCYPHTGKKKGAYKMFTVYGLTVQQVYRLLMKELEE